MCRDNARAESFSATLKNERAHPTRGRAMSDIASWIELIYNHTRLHSSVEYRTPNEAEREPLNHKKAARPTQHTHSPKTPSTPQGALAQKTKRPTTPPLLPPDAHAPPTTATRLARPASLIRPP